MKAASPATIIQVSELLNEVEGRDMDFSNEDEQLTKPVNNNATTGFSYYARTVEQCRLREQSARP